MTIQSTQRTRVVVEMSCDSALSNVILFDRYLDQYEIWMMRPDGSGGTLFLAGGSGPVLTPDGTRIVYETGGRLSVIRVDKTRIRQAVPGLPGGQYQPDVSPDGQSVAFTAHSISAPPWQLYRANLDGTDVRQLTATGQVDMNPRWSPDGRFIAFTRSSSDQSDPQVMLMAADGTNPVALTAPGAGCCPSWSPEGSRLLFAKSTDRLWTMAPDGTGAQPLVIFGERAEWSPDGGSLLVEIIGDAGVDLWRAALDGSDFTRLASGGYNRLGRWYR